MHFENSHKKAQMIFWSLLFLFVAGLTHSKAQTVDPAGWGGNHVGKPIPEYVHGDECLFCHRNTIGVTWQKNAHGLTVRQGEDAPELQTLAGKLPELSSVVNEIGYFLGSRHRVRFLKKSGYGKFSMLNLQAVLGANVIEKGSGDSPSWDKEKFGRRCAGCHATAVDASTNSFAAFGIDCYACHGLVSLDHSNNTSLMWLSKKRRDDVPGLCDNVCALLQASDAELILCDGLHRVRTVGDAAGIERRAARPGGNRRAVVVAIDFELEGDQAGRIGGSGKRHAAGDARTVARRDEREDRRHGQG